MREFTARCGARMLIPAGWITASDREPSSQPAEETLYLVGDFNADVIDTASLRRVRAPPDADTWLDGSLPAAEVAQRLTAAEREAVAAGTAVVSLAGVVGATTGTLSFALLSSAKEVRQGGRFYFTVETQQRQCRGTITEGSGGMKQCTGPNGDDLPAVERHALNVFTYASPYVYMLRVSCAEARWPGLKDELTAVAASFDASHVRTE